MCRACIPFMWPQVVFSGMKNTNIFPGSFQVVLVVKNSVSNVRDITDECSIAWSGRSPGGGHGNALQYSCLEKPMDRGAWQATVHGVAKSLT